MRQLNNRQLAAILAAAFVIVVIAFMVRPGTSETPEAPAAATTEQPAPATATPATPVVTDEKSKKILELFNPSDQMLTGQLNETAISQQIEQILTSSFVLTACKLMTGDDYRDSYRASILYAQRSKLAKDSASAEAKVRLIAKSAGASYSLVYSRTKCNDPKLPENARQLLEWQHSILPKEE